MASTRPSRAWLPGVAVGLLLATTGCSQAEDNSQRRFRYAEAVEVPVNVTERDQLAALLAGFAQRNGLAYRDTSPRAQRISNGRQTLDLQIERPLTNGHLWTEIHVSALGNEAALITFAAPLDKGVQADAEQGRAAILTELRRRWPATKEVPLSPDGGLVQQ